MDIIYVPAFIGVFLIVNFFFALKNKKFDKVKRKKLSIAVYVFVTIMFSTHLVDYISVLGYGAGIWDLPAAKGSISEIRINKKPGAPSKLILNGREYKVGLSMIKDRKFFQNTTYKIVLTPINRQVCSIIELEENK